MAQLKDKLGERTAFIEGKFKDKAQMEKLEKEYWPKFEKQGQYLGNGIYAWGNVYGVDTRHVFLLGILEAEGIYIDNE